MTKVSLDAGNHMKSPVVCTDPYNKTVATHLARKKVEGRRSGSQPTPHFQQSRKEIVDNKEVFVLGL